MMTSLRNTLVKPLRVYRSRILNALLCELIRGENMIKEYDLDGCPRCGNNAAVDFEEHMIYCTGCPLTVQDTEMAFNLLRDIWNSLGRDIST